MCGLSGRSGSEQHAVPSPTFPGCRRTQLAIYTGGGGGRRRRGGGGGEEEGGGGGGG